MPTAFSGDNPHVITMIAQTLSPLSLQAPSEVRGLLYDRNIAAKVLSWDSFSYGTEAAYKPEDIEAVAIQEDIVWYRIGTNGAIPISIDQFLHFWEQIKLRETEPTASEPTAEEIVSLAKSEGTVIWEHGCKLGYIVRIGSWFYAVSEVLTPRGFKYSYSRHGSFYLAHSELVEQSWDVEEVV